MTQEYVLPKAMPRDQLLAKITRNLAALPLDSAWRVEIVQHKPRRSDAQNRLLWSLYQQIIDKGGEAMAGWERDDLHEYFLIRSFGSDVRDVFGKKRHTPARRSSSLSKQEMTDHIEAIVRFMAERGVVLDMPEEETDW